MAKKKITLKKLLEGSLIERRECMYKVDPEKAFQKLSSKQLQDPFDAVRELIANAIDAYEGMGINPRIEVNIDKDLFCLTDYGIGMDENKLRALRTLGSSDKSEDCIGRFGIGFASLFHPLLNVSKVVVDTKDSQHREFVFDVVEPGKKVTLEDYVIDTPVDYSTKISVVINDREVLSKIRRKLVDVVKYLPFDILFNNFPLPRLKNFGIEHYIETVRIDKNGITGFIASDPFNPDPRITVLSQNLVVENIQLTDMSWDIKNLARAAGSFVGVINYDSLNLVPSRNEVQRDEKWIKLCNAVTEAAEEFILKMIDDYNKIMSQKKRMELIDIFYLFNSNEGYVRHFFQCGKNKFEEKFSDRLLIKKFLECPIFQVWHDPRTYSIADLKEIWLSQKKTFLCAYNEEDLDLLLKSDYKGKVLKTSLEEGNGDLEDKLKQIYTRKLNAIDIDNLRGDEELQERLVEKGIIDPESLTRICEYVADTNVSKNARKFIKEVRKLLNRSSVKKLFRKHGISTDIKIRFGKINSQNVIACYYDGSIVLNLDSPEMQPYLESDPVHAAYTSLPLFGHEVSHDKIPGHSNPFYNLKNVLTRELREIVSAIKVEDYKKAQRKRERELHKKQTSHYSILERYVSEFQEERAHLDRIIKGFDDYSKTEYKIDYIRKNYY